MSETSSSILVQCSSKCRVRSAGTFVDFCFMMFAQEGIRGFPLLDNFFGHLGEFCAFLRIFSSTQQEKMKIYDIQVGINLREVQIFVAKDPEQKQALLYSKVHGTRSLSSNFRRI